MSLSLRWLAILSLFVVACGGGTPSGPTRPPVPQIQCPANVTITDAIGNGRLVTYNQPIQVAGTTPITVNCTPPSGSTFPIGTTTVLCTAADALNQTGSCQFTVSVSRLTLSALKFVAFGDSVTAGENSLPAPGGLSTLFVDTANAYPTKLQQKLIADFPTQATTVFNAGLPGERATEGVDRLPGVLAANTPQALLLLDGYNDLLTRAPSAPQAVADALEEMIDIARASGVTYVFVSTITPGRTPTTMPPRQIPPALITEANTRIRSLALAEGAILVDNFNAFIGQETTLVSGDGLHLTAAGNEVLANTFLAAIKAVAAMGTGPLARLR